MDESLWDVATERVTGLSLPAFPAMGRHCSPSSDLPERRNFAVFLAAFPPFAPDRCRCGAGFSDLPIFLFGALFLYLVVDLTPSFTAEGSRTQMNPFFDSSDGGS